MRYRFDAYVETEDGREPVLSDVVEAQHQEFARQVGLTRAQELLALDTDVEAWEVVVEVNTVRD